MSESLETGLLLLAVGMLTVFAVLGIVVLTGRVLVFTMNRLAPNPVTTSPTVRTPELSDRISKAKIAAVTTIISTLVSDDARITRIECMES